MVLKKIWVTYKDNATDDSINNNFEDKNFDLKDASRAGSHNENI